MIKRLKDESYYNNLYDFQTVAMCLRRIDSWEKMVREKPADAALSNLAEDKKAGVFSNLLRFSLYYVKGERYRRKSATIREWINSDSRRDEFLEKAQAPGNIRYDHCHEDMHVILKELYEASGESLRVLFFFECRSCGKRKGMFDNGEKFARKPESCPKCGKEIKASCDQQGEIMIWERSCPACGFFEREEDDFEKMAKERKDEDERKAELLKKHRAEFCLTEKEGGEYLQDALNLEMLAELLKKEGQRQADPDYKEAGNLEKWNIVQLEKVLLEALKEERYQKLFLEQPQMNRHVIVPFTVQDADAARPAKDSDYKLRRIIRDILQGSNWRLMSEGVSYRLGYLSGRLKGYEQEDDLAQLIKREKL